MAVIKTADSTFGDAGGPKIKLQIKEKQVNLLSFYEKIGCPREAKLSMGMWIDRECHQAEDGPPVCRPGRGLQAIIPGCTTTSGQELRMKIYLALSVIFLWLVLPASGDIYTWTDANGVIHFSNEPPPIQKGVERQPEIKHSAEQYDQWEQQRQSDQNKILEESRSREEGRGKADSAAGRVTKRPGSVIMYTTPRCGYCARARAFFNKYGISYTDYDITADRRAHERFKELHGNGVPLIFVGKTRIPGYQEELLKNLFGIK